MTHPSADLIASFSAAPNTMGATPRVLFAQEVVDFIVLRTNYSAAFVQYDTVMSFVDRSAADGIEFVVSYIAIIGQCAEKFALQQEQDNTTTPPTFEDFDWDAVLWF